MSYRLLVSFSLLGMLSSMPGCGQATMRPSKHDVDVFIQRREFVLKQVGRIKPPMKGTSYAGNTQNRYEHPATDNFIVMPPHAHVRSGVEKYGYWMTDHPFIQEFEVSLEDDLVKTVTDGDIARRLNKHYASELIGHGWRLRGFSEGGNGSEEKNRYWAIYIWSDLGKEIPADGPGLSASYSVNENDLRRGHFNVMIAVCVDTKSRRAHILIGLDERLGFAYLG